MKRTAMPRRKTRLKRRSAKRASEWLRIYGSEERVEWVKSLPCCVVDCRSRDIENMHIESGGVGRKADYDKIVPCCRGHHRWAHQHGVETFQSIFDVDLELAAIATQQAWLAFQARNA